MNNYLGQVGMWAHLLEIVLNFNRCRKTQAIAGGNIPQVGGSEQYKREDSEDNKQANTSACLHFFLLLSVDVM